ncbi:MAG TPA: circadian clock protein KaiC [Syntrophorhabdaceae bacterium]|nr:circadian clock protein KaiC [Syntrophorhabdaceae bacterium]
MRKGTTNTKEILEKCPTGISGLDEITKGGLPKGRPSLVAGGAGCGKTVLAMEFLVRGAINYNEPGVFMAFEETEKDLTQNFQSLGFDLKQLEADNKIRVDHVYIERSEIEETGEYDLEGLFVRLNYAIDSIGAKRVVLDTIEALFSGLTSVGVLRAELRRLFRWLKTKGVTAVITAERGESTLTRYGLEEYVADCVIILDHRVTEQISTRRMRIVKYRGSSHGMNEYPFLITEDGVSVLPITTVGLSYNVSSDRISTGIHDLDKMFDGKGYYRGSSILVSGTAGTGKSILAASFAARNCDSGEKCAYFAFEESVSQILRNMRSVGLNLAKYHKEGTLTFRASRPSSQGLEMHLLEMQHLIAKLNPTIVVTDPITNLIASGARFDVKPMLTRFIDFLKTHNITAVFTNLSMPDAQEETDIGISSLMDTWIMLTNVVSDNRRSRGLSIVKSRGMNHSSEIKEFTINSKGIIFRDIEDQKW